MADPAPSGATTPKGDFDLLLTITKSDQHRRTIGESNSDNDNQSLGWQLDVHDVVADRIRPVFHNFLDYDDEYKTLQAEDPNRNHMYIPALHQWDKDVVALSTWQPGVGEDDDCKLVSAQDLPNDDQVAFIPKINTGFYSIGSEDHYLYSDYSVVDYIDPTSAPATLRLSSDPNTAFPLTARIYRRGTCGWAQIHRDYIQTDSLSGLRFSKEFILSEDSAGFLATFNDVGYVEFLFQGSNDDPIGVLEVETDDLGTSDGKACQQFKTLYFPLDYIETTDITVWVVPSAAHFISETETWTIVSDLRFADETKKWVYLDKDLGILTFGGNKAADTRLCNYVDDQATTFDVLTTSGFTNQGMIRLYNEDYPYLYEDVLYYFKDNAQFSDIIRGANGTTARSWGVNTIVSDIQAGAIPASDSRIFVAYKAIPRFEYEPIMSSLLSPVENHVYRDVTAYKANINPFRHTQSEGLFYINRCDAEVASIAMEVLNKSLSAGRSDTYGPVYIGNDYATIKVTAYDSQGNPIPNADITVDLGDDPGTLNGRSSITQRTGADGSFIITYKSPVGADDLGTFSSSVTLASGQTTIDFDDTAEFNGINPDEIYLYQVTKDSPTLGTLGYSGIPLNDISAQNSPYISGSGFTMIGIRTDLDEYFFTNGVLYLTSASGQVYSRTVKYFTKGWSGAPGWNAAPANEAEVSQNNRLRVFHFDTILPAVTFTKWRAVQEDAVDWDSTILNGRKTIVYIRNSDPDLTHPSLNISEVYGPLRPTTVVDDNTLIYGELLEIPDAQDNDVVLGAYWSITPKTITISAYRTGLYCGSGTILAATIKLLVTLPPSMLGVYIVDNLKIPYGFRVISTDFDAASTFNGATFITINTNARFGSQGPFISTPVQGQIIYGDAAETGFPACAYKITVT